MAAPPPPPPGKSLDTAACAAAAAPSASASAAAAPAPAPAASVPTLFAYDCSGSTGGRRGYHSIAQRILSELPAGAQIVTWDDKWDVVTRHELDAINAGMRGYGGTAPVKIAEAAAVLGFRGHLVILTDGEVSQGDVEAADKAMRELNLHFASTKVHIVGPRPNLSVSCPFTRLCPFEVKQYRGETKEEGKHVAGVTTTDLETLATLDSVTTEEEFAAAYSSLENVITAATMGTGEGAWA